MNLPRNTHLPLLGTTASLTVNLNAESDTALNYSAGILTAPNRPMPSFDAVIRRALWLYAKRLRRLRSEGVEKEYLLILAASLGMSTLNGEQLVQPRQSSESPYQPVLPPIYKR